MPTESARVTSETLETSGLPARVRDTLAQCLEVARKALDGAIFRALERFEWDVTSGSRTEDWMRDRGDHNLLVANRTSLAPAYYKGIEATFARLRREPDPLQLAGGKKRIEPSSQWSLESQSGTETTFEETTFANILLVSAQLPVYLLGMRMAVLAGAPAMDPDQVPLGPKHLLDTFSDAVLDIFGSTFSAPKLLQRFHEELLLIYPSFVDGVNELLGDEGILPGLTHMPIRKKALPVGQAAPKTAHPAWKSAAPGRLDGGVDEDVIADWLGQPQLPTHHPVMRHLSGDASAGQAFAFVPTAWPTDAAPAGTSAAPAAPTGAPVSAAPPDLMKLRQLLAAHRAATGLDALGHVARRQEDELPRQAVTQAFDRIQDRTKGSVENLRQAGIQSIEDLREHLLGELRQEHGEEKGLSRVDADILDLFALLYRAIAGEVRDGSPMGEMLDRLQVPMARAAYDDNRFFEEAEHPGRKVLELVADSDSRLGGEGGGDPFFESAVAKAVSRIEETYRGETAVLDAVSDELAAEQKQQVKRAEAAEHRQVEAARGKERLHVARKDTHEAVDAMLEGRTLPAASENLIRTAWQDALSFVMLRSGAASEAWAQQKAVTERIIETVSANDARVDTELEIMVGKALRRVGYHESDAKAVAELLSRGREAERSDLSASPTAVAARIAKHARFGEEGEAGEAAAEEKAPRNTVEQASYELLRELPIGTWYDFVLNQQGVVERRRMSWYSSVSDRVLLVNRRGQRVSDMTLDDMARLMAVGQVSIARHDDISVFDRAMKSVGGVLANMRGLFGRKGDAA